MDAIELVEAMDEGRGDLEDGDEIWWRTRGEFRGELERGRTREGGDKFWGRTREDGDDI